jgi:hypothetical protein
VRPAWCWRKRGVRRTAAGSDEAGEAEAELAQEKAKAELSLAPPILRLVRLAGQVVSGDALYCQRTLCQQIRQAHGHYLFFLIKANQPELLAEVTLLFDPPPPGERFASVTSRRTKRDRLEVRTLTASAALADYLHELGWMGAQQVLRWESQVTAVGGTRKGQTTRLVRYFLTSLGRVDPREVLRLVRREHWHVEIVCTQMTKPHVLTGGRGRDDVADLDVAVGDDHPVNEQFHQLALLLEGGLGESSLYPLAECLYAGG